MLCLYAFGFRYAVIAVLPLSTLRLLETFLFIRLVTTRRLRLSDSGLPAILAAERACAVHEASSCNCFANDLKLSLRAALEGIGGSCG